MKRTAIQNELIAIATKNHGLLRPEDVVKVAKNKNSILHSWFEWNQGKAAHEYRLWQARKLIISYRIKIIERQVKPCRMYVSLKQDRYREKGGYRSLEVVLSQPNLREQLLQEALEELSYFEEKYNQLEELVEVFKAIKKVIKKKAKKKKGKKRS